MSNFGADVCPSAGGGAKIRVSSHADAASPVAFSFLDLRQRFGSTERAELDSLLQEKDPELLARGLLSFAGRLEGKGKDGQAALVYEAILGLNPCPSPFYLSGLSKRAQERLRSIRGEGSFGASFELHLRHFASEAANPATIPAMAAAGLAYRAARAGSLGRLLLAPRGIWTRGALARFIAGNAGFGAEVLAFAGAARATQATLGRKMDWSAKSLADEIAQSALFLGPIKVLGSVVPRRVLFWQAGLFAGIHAGHGLQVFAGYRPASDGTTAMVDSLATLLSLNVAGNLSRAMLGRRFAALEAGLDYRAAAWSAPIEATVKNFASRPLQMASGQNGRLIGLLPPSSAFPPRSSDIFPSRNGPGNAKIQPPSREIEEILDLLLPHRSLHADALTRAARELNWLMPEDRSALIRWGIEATSAETVVDRLVAMAKGVESRDRRAASVHALRLLLLLQSGERPVSTRIFNKALGEIGAVLSPDSGNSAKLRWKIWESRLAYTLDNVVTEGGSRGSAVAFEAELGHLARGGFHHRFFDDLLYFSLELRAPKSRHLLASSAISLAMGPESAANPLRDFMASYYVVNRLAETGHLSQAAGAAKLAQLRSQNWSRSGFPKSFQNFLRERLAFQAGVVAQYSEILKAAEPKEAHAYYQAQGFGHLHMPEPWGLIWSLREHATLLHQQRNEQATSAMNRRLQLGESLMRDMVLDPFIAKALHESPELSQPRQRLLDLAEALPARARTETQEPLQAIFNALAARREWGEAYHLLDALYHLQIADPMLLRQVHASLLVGLDVAKHQALETPDFPGLSAQLTRLSDFESRFF